jgi:hypothetical protein
VRDNDGGANPIEPIVTRLLADHIRQSAAQPGWVHRNSWRSCEAWPDINVQRRLLVHELPPTDLADSFAPGVLIRFKREPHSSCVSRTGRTHQRGTTRSPHEDGGYAAR